MSDSQVITRFAPSPTGYLHIGGARTALFNWLYARANNGKFMLRIEDTDRARSTPEATRAIFDGLKWLGLDWDGDAVSQFERRARHAEVAHAMLANGTAYKCYATKDEIEAFRDQARAEGRPTLFQSPWRDADPAIAPDAPYVVRLKAPREGEIRIKDKVQKQVKWKAEALDDLVMLRSDGTPTYMLAVVVDDHDMGVTHIIRGDDHLINAGRQSLIYRALGWDIPVFAHIPLIHGEDGKKLSKRHGALGIEEYRAMGYTPAALRNYLVRLGWSHGNDELFTTEQAVEWFDFKGIGKAPARLDFKKLDNVSSFHIQNTPDPDLVTHIEVYLSATEQPNLTQQQRDNLLTHMQILKNRSKKLPGIIEKAYFLLGERPFIPNDAAAAHLNSVSRGILNRLTPLLQSASWSPDGLEDCLRCFADTENLNLGQIAQPLRAALTGRTVSPSVFEMMVALGKDETIGRLQDATV
ncbi:MAG: glutamate--tRNA ligase [Rhodobacteraceae bacterium]|nr:glutamate--tRNA ligase [Paracoccaceae bacterium]